MLKTTNLTYIQIVSGERVIVHCMGGLGRTGTFSVCLTQILFPTMSPGEAFDFVRKYRKGACDSDEQEEFVKKKFPQLLKKWKSTP